MVLLLVLSSASLLLLFSSPSPHSAETADPPHLYLIPWWDIVPVSKEVS